jgi:WD40 repeat protein
LNVYQFNGVAKHVIFINDMKDQLCASEYFRHTFDNLFNKRHLIPLLYEYYEYNVVASVNDKQLIEIRNLNTGELINTLREHIGSHTDSVFIDKKHNYIICGCLWGKIKIWDLTTLRLVHTLTDDMDRTLSVSVHDNIIASGNQNNNIMVWDLATDRIIYILTGHNKCVKSVCFDEKNSNIIVSGSWDRTVKVWNLLTEKIIHTLTGHTDRVQSVAVHNNIIVSGSDDRTVRVWNSVTGKPIHILTGHAGRVLSVAIHNNIIISGSTDKTVKVWDAETGKIMHTLTGHCGWVQSVCFDKKHSNMSSNIISGSKDGEIKMWNLTTGKTTNIVTVRKTRNILTRPQPGVLSVVV